ncbi:hypothetical protein IT397_00660 [Candidatus Nomurabacteria bacterium]|nr:hypothetical protein [Candidatus Nomurabacteria bacterium]
MDKWEKLVWEGVRRAQKIARETGLKVGQVVAHPSFEYTCYLTKKNGNVATLELPATKSPTGKKIEKEFPLDECFDPNVANDQAHAARDEKIAESIPGAVVVSTYP